MNYFVFSGYIDVVFLGFFDKWKLLFFSFVISKNKLYGCGVVDMKIGIVVMLVVIEWIIVLLDKEKVFFWWLIISDEEGEVEWGFKWIVEYLVFKNV